MCWLNLIQHILVVGSWLSVAWAWCAVLILFHKKWLISVFLVFLVLWGLVQLLREQSCERCFVCGLFHFVMSCSSLRWTSFVCTCSRFREKWAKSWFCHISHTNLLRKIEKNAVFRIFRKIVCNCSRFLAVQLMLFSSSWCAPFMAEPLIYSIIDVFRVFDVKDVFSPI
jgi:hypothetical protein